ALWLANQRADGGWNCDVGSDRSSFHTTIFALEGPLESERAGGGASELESARHRAHEELFEQRIMCPPRTGHVGTRRGVMMSFPPRWFYTVLRALDYLRAAGMDPDSRADEAVTVVDSKRRKDGRWPLQNRHAGREHFEMEEGPGKPSRWNTLRALRVLAWYRGPRPTKRLMVSSGTAWRTEVGKMAIGMTDEQ